MSTTWKPPALLKARRLCGALLLLVCLPGAIVAQDDEIVTAEDAADAAAIRRELTQREQAIEDLQSDFGVYDPVLVEAYSDLGAYFSKLGDYGSAVQVYNSALQVARISNGLNSEQQLPVLQLLIENYSMLKDWQKVDDLQHLVYYISSRVYALSDKEFLLAATNYGDWKLHVVRENLLDLGSRGLANETEQLSEFYGRVIADIELNSDVEQEELLQILYGKSLADISLARVMALTPYTAFQGTTNPYVYETRCQNVVNSQGQVVRQCINVQVENPRYRESQWDAKQIAVTQYTREVNRSIDRLQAISDESVSLSAEQRRQLESHIGELQTESMQLLRSSRRRSLF